MTVQSTESTTSEGRGGRRSWSRRTKLFRPGYSRYDYVLASLLYQVSTIVACILLRGSPLEGAFLVASALALPTTEHVCWESRDDAVLFDVLRPNPSADVNNHLSPGHLVIAS